MKVSHVIFDMDGLLLDTEKLYSEGNQLILEKYGRNFEWECKAKQMGRKKREAIQILLDYYDLPITVAEYEEQLDAIHRQIMPTAQLLPGAERLVRHLHENSIPIAVATGSHRDFYEIKTQNHRELFSLFHHILCGDDPELKRGKPAPDGFLICASRFSPSISDSMSNVLIFEDAPNGVEAAITAGSPVVMVPDLRVDKEVRAKATVTLESLEDFKPEEFGLPPYL